VVVKAKPFGCIHFFANPHTDPAKKMTRSLDNHRPTAFGIFAYPFFCFFQFFGFVKKNIVLVCAVLISCVPLSQSVVNVQCVQNYNFKTINILQIIHFAKYPNVQNGNLDIWIFQ